LKFISEIERQIVDFMVAQTGGDKLSKLDALECERKFVDPFVC
jgi:hypothetical protein